MLKMLAVSLATIGLLAISAGASARDHHGGSWDHGGNSSHDGRWSHDGDHSRYGYATAMEIAIAPTAGSASESASATIGHMATAPDTDRRTVMATAVIPATVIPVTVIRAMVIRRTATRHTVMHLTAMAIRPRAMAITAPTAAGTRRQERPPAGLPERRSGQLLRATTAAIAATEATARPERSSAEHSERLSVEPSHRAVADPPRA